MYTLIPAYNIEGCNLVKHPIRHTKWIFKGLIYVSTSYSLPLVLVFICLAVSPDGAALRENIFVHDLAQGKSWQERLTEKVLLMFKEYIIHRSSRLSVKLLSKTRCLYKNGSYFSFIFRINNTMRRWNKLQIREVSEWAPQLF